MKKLSIVMLAILVVFSCVFAACEVQPETKTYNVTLSTGEGYTLTGDKTVEGGKDYTFTLKIADGYEKSADFAVKANNQTLTAQADGSYKVANVSADLTISVSGVTKKATVYKVTLPSGEGYTINGETTVVEGADYTFTVVAATGYNLDYLVVNVNDEEIDNNGNVGSYTVEKVSSDLTVTVDGVMKNTLAVTLNEGIGYKIAGEESATYGEDYIFTVTIKDAFKQADNFAVKANGTVLTAEADGSYKVAAPTEAVEITVEGVTIDENKKDKFLFSIDDSTLTYDAAADVYTASSDAEQFAWGIDKDVVAYYKAQGKKYLSLYMRNKEGMSNVAVYINDKLEVKNLCDLTPTTGLYYTSTPNFLYPSYKYFVLDLDILYLSNGGFKMFKRDGSTNGTVYLRDITFSSEVPTETIEMLDTFAPAHPEAASVYIDGTLELNMHADGKAINISKETIAKWIADGKNTLSFTVKMYDFNQGKFVNNLNMYANYPGTWISAAAADFDAEQGKQVVVDLTAYPEGVKLGSDSEKNTFYLTDITLSHTDYVTVTFPETQSGYTLSGATTIAKGQAYTFNFALAEGYRKNASFAVKVNDEAVEVVDGKITVAADKVTDNLVVTVEGVEQITYNNVLTAGTGYTFEVLDGANIEAIPYGGTLKFKVVLAAGYTQSTIAVKDGENVLTAVDGVYTIADIKEAHTITVEGATLNTYDVSLPASENYTVSGAKTVTHGNDYTFTVSFAAGQDTSAVKVYAQIGDGAKTEITAQDGTYTVANVDGALTVTIEGLKVAKYTVTLNEVDGITYTSDNGATPATEAEHGSTYKFKVALNTSKYHGTLVVKNGDETLTADENGVYSVVVTANVNITVSGMEINTYNVTLTEGEGYTIAANAGSTSPVNYGGSFSFTVGVLSGYSADELVVKVNGTALEAKDGVYTIANITADIKVTVEGVKANHVDEVVSVDGSTVQYSDGVYTITNGDGNNIYFAIDKKLIEEKKADGYKFVAFYLSTGGLGNLRINPGLKYINDKPEAMVYSTTSAYLTDKDNYFMYDLDKIQLEEQGFILYKQDNPTSYCKLSGLTFLKEDSANSVKFPEAMSGDVNFTAINIANLVAAGKTSITFEITADVAEGGSIWCGNGNWSDREAGGYMFGTAFDSESDTYKLKLDITHDNIKTMTHLVLCFANAASSNVTVSYSFQ